MKSPLFVLVVVLFLWLGSLRLASSAELADVRVLEDFSSNHKNQFPSDFKIPPFNKAKAKKIYSVQEESGNFYLHASDKGETGIPIIKRLSWDTNQWPYFSWRWRAKKLPEKAELQDTACAVYVVFGGTHGNTLKYVWSTTLPAGTVNEHKPGKFFVIVHERGSKKVGSWITVNVNLKSDYKKYFKSNPNKAADGFAVLTDGDDTHSPSACDYDDFKISE